MKYLDHFYACQRSSFIGWTLVKGAAQTMANFYLAFEQDLTIIPVIGQNRYGPMQIFQVLREL